MDKVFVVTIVDYYSTNDGLSPNKEVLGVATTMAGAKILAEKKLQKLNTGVPIWHESSTDERAHTNVMAGLLAARIRAYDVVTRK